MAGGRVWRSCLPWYVSYDNPVMDEIDHWNLPDTFHAYESVIGKPRTQEGNVTSLFGWGGELYVSGTNDWWHGKRKFIWHLQS